MKKRPPDREPWMDAPDYGRSLLPGLGVNLLVRDVAKGVEFAQSVLAATATYSDEDFAVLRAVNAQWMLHADHTYLDNPMTGVIKDVEARGAGVELRLYGVDPDQAETAAKNGDWPVLSGQI